MKTKTILGMSLAAVFAVSMFGVAFASNNTPKPWQTFDTDSITVTTGEKITKLSLTADATVPHKTGALAGYCWFYDSGDYAGLCATTHNLSIDDDAGDVRDSTQNPDGWHLHNVKLGALTPSGHVCVADLSDAPTGGVNIKGSEVSVNARNSILKGDFAGSAASATIVVDAGCPATTGAVPSILTLALDVHTAGAPTP
jgi:hypothetical protein